MEEKVPKDAQVSPKSNGKTPSLEKVKLIRHFTSVENLESILQDGLKMGNTKKWEDKNDSYGIQCYAELQNGQKVLVLCFCATKGNVYHWNSLKNGEDLMCSIDIRKNDFFEYIKKLDGFQKPKSVIYCNNDDVLNLQNTDDLPYLKRAEYEIEKEIRILYIGKETEVYIPDIRDYVEQITIGTSDDEKIKQIKEELKKKLSESLRVPITTNGFMNSKFWQQNIDKIIANSK